MTRARELADLLTGGQTITTADNTAQLTLSSTDADANVGPLLVMMRDSSSPADNDILSRIDFKGDNDAGEETFFGSINAIATDVSDGTEDAQIKHRLMVGGAVSNVFELNSSEIIFNEDSKDIDFRVESNGNANMLVVDAGNDRIGIGTNTPAHDVEIVVTNAGSVNDSLQIRNNATSNGTGSRIRFINSTDNTSDANGASISSVRNGDDNDLVFETENSEAMRIDHTGKVGIGDTAPNVLLSVKGADAEVAIDDSNSAPTLRFRDNGSTRALLEVDASNNINFDTGPDGSVAERMRIDSTGRVSIHPDGTAFLGESSADNFNIYQTGANVGMTLRSDNDRAIGIYFADGASGGDLYRGYIQYNHANELFDFAGQGAVRLIAGGNEKVRVLTNSTPHVLVGCTSEPSSSVAGTAISTTSAGSFQSFSSTTNASTHAAFGNTNGVVGSIQTTNSTTAFNTSSDRRLKSNIEDAASASDKIDAIQVRQFDWKADDIHQDYGLIAQELQPIEPLAVTGDADSDKMMSVDYSKLVPMLIKEIQELRSRVTTLEAS